MSAQALFKLNPKETPIAILSEGCFGEHSSKTATGVLRYGEWPVVAVIDSTRAGETVRTVTGIPNDAPVLAGLEDALRHRPKALLIGTAPQGGGLPESWWTIVRQAVANGLHVISGLHTFLGENAELAALARERDVILWDVRHSDQKNIVSQKTPRPPGVKVVTLVGSDCSVGKMFTALELWRGARDRGWRASFVATGQTGILISGSGTPLDRVIGDFMAGHVERAIWETIARDEPEWIFVEGQGSLIHPGYSGVTMSLLHGSNPDAMVLCHQPGRERIHGYTAPIPSLPELVRIYETAAAWIRPGERMSAVAGVSLNCSKFNEEEAARIVSEARAATGLPATDPVRFDVTELLDGLTHVLSERKSLCG